MFNKTTGNWVVTANNLICWVIGLGSWFTVCYLLTSSVVQG